MPSLNLNLSLSLSPTKVGFLILVLAGVVIQSLLLRRAMADISGFEEDLRHQNKSMAEPVRQFFRDALITARTHRDQAVAHIAIKTGGVALVVWGFFTPSPVVPEVQVYNTVGGIYILAVFALLDVIAYRDYRSRRRQQATASAQHGDKPGGKAI